MKLYITCVSIDINGHSTEDIGAYAFLLFFLGGIKFKLLIQLGDFSSHVATLHTWRRAVRKEGEAHLDHSQNWNPHVQNLSKSNHYLTHMQILPWSTCKKLRKFYLIVFHLVLCLTHLVCTDYKLVCILLYRLYRPWPWHVDVCCLKKFLQLHKSTILTV